MHESNPQTVAGTPGLGNNYYLSTLESTYRRYGHGIYTFCLRLLCNEKAAESATVDVFVQFNREIASQPDESRTLLRLRELAINASVTRLNKRGRTMRQCLGPSLRLILRRIWRP
jgi:DNA-directed RNA polymerase specialized sigma24 family protein